MRWEDRVIPSNARTTNGVSVIGRTNLAIRASMWRSEAMKTAERKHKTMLLARKTVLLAYKRAYFPSATDQLYDVLKIGQIFYAY